jgi:hypothetical protein
MSLVNCRLVCRGDGTCQEPLASCSSQPSPFGVRSYRAFRRSFLADGARLERVQLPRTAEQAGLMRADIIRNFLQSIKLFLIQEIADHGPESILGLRIRVRGVVACGNCPVLKSTRRRDGRPTSRPGGRSRCERSQNESSKENGAGNRLEHGHVLLDGRQTA